MSEYEAPTDEEFAVSVREHPDVPSAVIELAIGMARERGGGTVPVGSYDIQRARCELAGNETEVAKLRAELAVVKADAAVMRSAINFTIQDASFHLKKYRAHCLDALVAARTPPPPAGADDGIA